MPDGTDRALDAALSRLAPKLGEGAEGVEALTRLSGGASQETWSFRLSGPGTPLILRRRPDAARPGKLGIPLEAEAELIARAAAQGVPVPDVVHVLTPEDDCGVGFVMSRVEGETIPRRILRDPDFAPAREGFAAQAGRILAAIHRIAAEGPVIASLDRRDAAAALASLERRHRTHPHPRPVFELAFRRLAATVPPSRPLRLVHGDFRVGNLMFGPQGVSAVLDWELAHVGDPLNDLGWLCTPSWRFGAEPPVGGLGDRETLWEAYEAAGGGSVEPAAARWWETFGILHWGVIVEDMESWVRTGADRSVERHVIARRASETELSLMIDLTGREV